MQVDLILVGGGMVGLALARALVEDNISEIPLKIAIIESDPQPSSALSELRVSALNQSTLRQFHQWGIWNDKFFPDRAPYRHMEIGDQHSSGKLSFHASDLGQESLGYIVKNDSIIQALKADLSCRPTVTFFHSPQWTSLEQISVNAWEMELSDGQRISAKVLVGADGAASRIREFLKIPCYRTDYGQQALVAKVSSEKPHGFTAYQRFLTGGPLAWLPLKDRHEGSIVWTLPFEESEIIKAMSEAEFNTTLTTALDGRLGTLSLQSPRVGFSLKTHHAKSYVTSGAFLIGDAAHGIHPLAGQGVNLGFHDVQVISQILAEAKRNQRPGLTFSNFKKYERQAWMYNESIRQSMTLINSLFSGEKKPSLCLKARGLGMNLINRFGIVKDLFSQVAQG